MDLWTHKTLLSSAQLRVYPMPAYRDQTIDQTQDSLAPSVEPPPRDQQRHKTSGLALAHDAETLSQPALHAPQAHG